jgi:colicin import membrane protein
MRTLMTILLLFVFVFTALHAFAQGKKNEEQDRTQNKHQSVQVDGQNQKGKDAVQKGKKSVENHKQEPVGKYQQKEGAKQGDALGKEEQLQDKEVKEHKGKGHAYGKNKGELKGRDFGMLRSEEARSKMKGKLDHAESEVDLQIQRIEKMNQRIEEAKSRNEENFKGGKITRVQYEANEERINEAGAIVSETEQKAKKEKQNISSAKKDLK